jgi:hypothetical protein
VIQSSRTNVILAKFWVPILCIVATFGVFGENLRTWRFLFALPFIIAALFWASIAILEVRGGVLRYRRFFKWTIVRSEEIKGAGVVWHPFIGYIRFDRYVFPWGRLYFALDASPSFEINPFRRSDYALLRCLRNEPIQQEHGPAKASVVKDRSPIMKLLAAGVVGALIPIFFHFAFRNPIPRSQFEHPFGPKSPKLMVPLEIYLHVINSLPFILVFSVSFILLAAFRRNRPNAWIFAFLAGVSMPYILFHWL